MLIPRVWRIGVVLLAALAWSSLSGCFNSCVVEGTDIATPRGPRPIETLCIGDEVLTRSPNGRAEVGTVTDIHRHTSDGYLLLLLDDGRHLEVTSNHPVGVPGGWQQAGDLVRGDRLLTGEGEAVVSMVRPVAGVVRVYDLTVTPNENFIAGGVVVHNKSYGSGATNKEIAGSWIGDAGGRIIVVDLTETGSGFAAYATHSWPETTKRYRVERFVHQDFSHQIRIVFQDLDDPAEPSLIVEGEVYGQSLAWSASIKFSEQGHAFTIYFSRPGFIDEQADLARKAIESVKAAPSEATGRGP